MCPKNKKYMKFFSTFLVLVFVFSIKSYAASLQLLKIGSLDLGGNMYSEWWYTGTKPTLYGKADSTASVDIKVGEVSSSVVADTSGNWSYLLDKEPGDYNIELTSGAENITFTLHLGQNVPTNLEGTEETTQSDGTVPDTGFHQFAAMMFGVGVILLASYLYVSTDSKRKAVFETRIIKED